MKSTKMLTATILVSSALIWSAVLFSTSRFNAIPQGLSNLTASTDHAAFPQIDTTKLSSSQQKILAILKQEYETQPKGTKYSEGVNEPWCADFVSWIFREAGAPLNNPNSGSWRIPGTHTLRAYYESIGKFKPASSGYSPAVGDIMLYDNPSPFGQHTNIVIKNEGGVITTVGGNEPGGIRVFVHRAPDKAGFIGYGVLSK
jgi:hypothetical protein